MQRERENVKWTTFSQQLTKMPVSPRESRLKINRIKLHNQQSAKLENTLETLYSYFRSVTAKYCLTLVKLFRAIFIE